MTHKTVLEINSENIRYNLDYFRSLLNPGTRVMVMVKAFGYGHGNPEISRLFEKFNVDYLGVAFVHEGVSLRKAGIKIPIMVMNPFADQFDLAMEYDLELEIFNMGLLGALDQFLRSHPGSINIHLKVETGMQRLGFPLEDFEKICEILKHNKSIHISGLMSHLSAAEYEEEVDFTLAQVRQFEEFYNTLVKELGIKALRHILNTAGILFYPQYQFEMVRLGIGVYGVDLVQNRDSPLRTVCTLKTVISQIKTLNKGDTVGYGRLGKVNKDNTRIATLSMGYADGFYRSLGKGKSSVWINGRLAPTIGNICMDMFMIDVTDLDVKEGDEVEIFGEHQSIGELAKAADTIPYELFTSLGERIRRIII